MRETTVPFRKNNIRFRYRYLDSTKRKRYDSLVFYNPNKYSIEEITAQLWSALIDKQYFTHRHLSVPVLSLFPFYVENGNTCYEILSIEGTEMLPTDDRTVEDFIRAL